LAVSEDQRLQRIDVYIAFYVVLQRLLSENDLLFQMPTYSKILTEWREFRAEE